MDFLAVDDISLHFRIQNLPTRAQDRPIIVFCNSLGTDFRIWDEVIAAMGDEFGYVLYDQRGQGLSGVGTTPYSIESHAEDLIRLLDHLELGDLMIWGLSVGGLIAQSVYAKRPDLVRALVLSNTAHKIGTAETWNARIDIARGGGLAALVDPVMERWFTPAFRRPDNALFLGCRAMLARQPVDGYCGTCEAIRDADFSDVSARIAVPTLCVAGDQDGATPPPLVQECANLIPHSRYAEISDCGHIPCVEQPALYAATVSAFLNNLSELN